MKKTIEALNWNEARTKTDIFHSVESKLRKKKTKNNNNAFEGGTQMTIGLASSYNLGPEGDLQIAVFFGAGA